MQHIIYTGDFNLGNINWKFTDNNYSLISYNMSSEVDFLLVDFFCQLDLIQINHVLNDFNRAIDLAFVDKDLVSNISQPIAPLFNKSVHHSPFLLEVSVLHQQKASNYSSLCYDYNRGDLISMNTYLENIDWAELFHDNDIESMYCKFLSVLDSASKTFIPLKRLRNIKYPAWYNKRLINLKNRKNKAFKHWRLERNNFVLKASYLRCQSEFDTLNKFLYKSYLFTTEATLKSNSKFLDIH